MSSINWLTADAPIRTRESAVAGTIRVCQACGGELPRPRDRWTVNQFQLCSAKCSDKAYEALYATGRLQGTSPACHAITPGQVQYRRLEGPTQETETT